MTPTDAAIAQAFREAVACFQPSYLPFARLDVESVLRRARELDAEKGGEDADGKLIAAAIKGMQETGSMHPWAVFVWAETVHPGRWNAAPIPTPPAQAAEAVLVGAARRVTDAFKALGKTTNIGAQIAAHRECEAAMLNLDAAIAAMSKGEGTK